MEKEQNQKSANNENNEIIKDKTNDNSENNLDTREEEVEKKTILLLLLRALRPLSKEVCETLFVRLLVFRSGRGRAPFRPLRRLGLLRVGAVFAHDVFAQVLSLGSHILIEFERMPKMRKKSEGQRRQPSGGGIKSKRPRAADDNAVVNSAD